MGQTTTTTATATATATAMYVILLLLFLGVVVVLILCLTGVIRVGSNCSTSMARERERERERECEREIAFSATNDAGGSVTLSWTFDGIEGTDYRFPVKIYTDPTVVPETRSVTLVKTVTGSGSESLYRQTVGESTYTATLDGATYFVPGTNWVAIASEIQQSGNVISSVYTDSSSVRVDVDVTTAASFVGNIFTAIGYDDPTNDITSTKFALLWKHALPSGTVPSQICYRVTGTGSISDLGFATPSENAGIDVSVTADTIQVSFTDELRPSPFNENTLCSLDPSFGSTVYYDDTNSIYYIYVVAANDPTPKEGEGVTLTLTTMTQECTDAIAENDTASAKIWGASDAPVISNNCLDSECTFVSVITPTVHNVPDVCTTSYGSSDIDTDKGGANVQLSLNWTPSIDHMFEWTVTESVIASEESTYIAYSSTSSITWALPSGYYTPSCWVYAHALADGPLMKVLYTVGEAFTVQLPTPEGVTVATG
jgi:hypothetical protein